jgi:apolipoprotein N-acyltransferase
MIPRAIAAIGALTMWAAFKPLGLWPLAIVSAFCWCVLISIDRPLPKRAYTWMYFMSALAWLGLLQGIRLAYWPLYAGWAALSLYIAVYIPLFVLVSRFMVHRWRLPLVAVAPIVWAGCELLRCYLLTGFGGCLLSHTLTEQPMLIQWAAHLGPQLLSGFIILIGACIYEWLKHTPKLQSITSRLAETPSAYASLGGKDRMIEEAQASTSMRSRWLSTLVVILMLGGSIAIYYNGQRLAQSSMPLMKVALIQENLETRFDYVESELDERAEKLEASLRRYEALTYRTAKANPNIDLVVWPESIFTPFGPYFEWDGSRLPDSFAPYVGDAQYAYQNARSFQRDKKLELERLHRISAGDPSIDTSKPIPVIANVSFEGKRPAMLLGANVFQIKQSEFEKYNAALFKPSDAGEPLVYPKRYLVMFGEYVPFAKRWPGIYESLGMMEINRGKDWAAFDVNGSKIAPSICFENMIPQVMRSQTASLKSKGTAPDVLVNLTNDGWFRGSSMLDHHHACAVFAAVENRRPMLVAANTGISSWISGNGVIMAKSTKGQPEAIVAQPTADGRWGLWQSIGDIPAWLCAAVIIVVLVQLVIERQVKLYRERMAAVQNAKPA